MRSATSRTAAQEDQRKTLRTGYRKAFREWAAQVGGLLALLKSEGGSDASKQAEVQVEEAEKAYHEARNLMVDDANGPAHNGPPRSSEGRSGQY